MSAAEDRGLRAQGSVLVADDHAVLRQGLVLLIHSQSAYQVVAEAEDGKQALDLLKAHLPKLAVVDLAMPRMKGYELIATARQLEMPTRFVVLTMHNHPHLADEVKRAGADACVLKDDAFSDLLAAMSAALAGDFYTSRSIAQPSLKRVSERLLTEREKGIVRAIIAGRTNKEIAHEIGISVKTVETHRERLMKKLGARNSADIVRLGIKMGV